MIPIYVQSTSGETQMLTMRLKTEDGRTAEGGQITIKCQSRNKRKQMNKFSVTRLRLIGENTEGGVDTLGR
jgi:hypothetical protein